jgi:Flp pilus assembly CpaE family ATPase
MQKQKVRVILIEDNIVCAKLVEGMLARPDVGSFDVQRTDRLLSTLDLITKSEFDVALLDLTLPDSQGLETFLTVRRYAPLLPVIVVTGVDDESVALNAVRQGAQDYLVKAELNQEKLVRAINYALARTQMPSSTAIRPKQKAPIIGMIGSKGGVGTTTLACHWAIELGRQTGDTVLFADLDVSSSCSSFLLKVNSPYSLADAALNLHRLDSDLWGGMVSHVRDGLDVLQAPGATHLNEATAADRIRHVLRFAQFQYPWVVVDLGRLTSSSLTLLEECSDLFVVTVPELTALHETGRTLRRVLDAKYPPNSLKLLLNRHLKGKSFSPADIEKALGHPVYSPVSDFSDELAEAYGEGHFLDEKLKLRREVARIVGRWRGLEEVQSVSSNWFLKRLRA